MKILVSIISVIALWSVMSINGWAEVLSNVIYQGCYDGDTCRFDVVLPAVLTKGMRIRLVGIDTPEIQGKCEKEIALAKVARDFLKTKLVGANVILSGVSKDMYFRLDAIVIANGVNLNQLLIDKGYAVPYSGFGPKKDWCR